MVYYLFLKCIYIWLIAAGKAQVYLQILYLYLPYQCRRGIGELSGLYLHLADHCRRSYGVFSVLKFTFDRLL